MSDQDQHAKQALSELEFCLNRYFTENYAPIIDRISAQLEAKKSEEHIAHMEGNGFLSMLAGAAGPDGGATAVHAQDDIIKTTGEWNTRTSDWLLKSCQEEFQSDSAVVEDLLLLAKHYENLFKSRLGDEGYKKISEELPRKDLALTYVLSRFDELFVEHLARKEVPQSSLEYIMKQGLSDTFISWSLSSYSPSSSIDEKIKQCTKELYDPSTTERILSAGIGIGTDILTTGGTTSAASFAASVTVETLARLTELVAEGVNDPKEFSHQLGMVVYGNESLITDVQTSAKKISPEASPIVSQVNSSLNKKMRTQAYIPQYSEEEKQMFEKMFKKASSNGDMLFENITKVFVEYGMSVKNNAEIPQWMKDKPKQECYNMSVSFAAMACEMKNKRKNVINIKDRKYTFEEVCQRAYDYARVAKSESPHQSPVGSQSPYVASSVQPSNQSGVQPSVMMHQPDSSSNATAQKSTIAGWNGLMDQLGYSALGKMWDNLGYVFAMLPDVIAGIFTGKTRNLRFKDNLLPISAIMMGLFVKRNPLLRMILLGFGGLSLIKKVGNAIVDDAQGKSVNRTYRAYADEKLNPRVANVVIKGNTMLCNIDGKPLVLTISDVPIDAYYKGKLPLNTLANAVLAKYDEQQGTLTQSYEYGISLQDNEKQNISIK